jgi:hypothetical protein
MVHQDSLFVTLVKLVDRIPTPPLSAERHSLQCTQRSPGVGVL